MSRKFTRRRERNEVSPKMDRVLLSNLIRVYMTKYKATFPEAKDIVLTKFPALITLVNEFKLTGKDFL